MSASTSKIPSKYQDPRWQKKRLEVLNRCNFSCYHCKSSDKFLHVHHLYYQRNRDPWDYPWCSLVALCASCHEKIGAKQDRLNGAIGLNFETHGDRIMGYLMGIRLFQEYGEVDIGAHYSFDKEQLAIGIADAFNVPAEAVYELIRYGGDLDSEMLWSLKDFTVKKGEEFHAISISSKLGKVSTLPSSEASLD